MPLHRLLTCLQTYGIQNSLGNDSKEWDDWKEINPEVPAIKSF